MGQAARLLPEAGLDRFHQQVTNHLAADEGWRGHLPEMVSNSRLTNS
jgi:hypothetical protein